MIKKQVDVELEKVVRKIINYTCYRQISEEYIIKRFTLKLKSLFKTQARECVIPEFIKGKCNCNEDYRIAVNDCRQWILNNIDSKFK
jgi:hypothetical protein